MLNEQAFEIRLRNMQDVTGFGHDGPGQTCLSCQNSCVSGKLTGLHPAHTFFLTAFLKIDIQLAGQDHATIDFPLSLIEEHIPHLVMANLAIVFEGLDFTLIEAIIDLRRWGVGHVWTC